MSSTNNQLSELQNELLEAYNDNRLATLESAKTKQSVRVPNQVTIPLNILEQVTPKIFSDLLSEARGRSGLFVLKGVNLSFVDEEQLNSIDLASTLGVSPLPKDVKYSKEVILFTAQPVSAPFGGDGQSAMWKVSKERAALKWEAIKLEGVETS